MPPTCKSTNGVTYSTWVRAYFLGHYIGLIVKKVDIMFLDRFFCNLLRPIIPAISNSICFRHILLFDLLTFLQFD